VDLARRAGTPERAASYEAASAVREAFYGNPTEARRHASAALALSTNRDTEFAAGLAFLLSGESSRARTLTDEIEKRFPEDTTARITYVPLLRAIEATSRRDTTGALQQLETCKSYELGITQLWSAFIGNLYPIYFRGQAYLAAGRAPEAAVEFQRILDHPGIVFTDPVGVVARLGLARARAASSDKAGAAQAYQDFFKFWKDADPDNPLLRQAQAEHRNLTSGKQ
jgi:tetratricopeptide (TPR) repeat protein